MEPVVLHQALHGYNDGHRALASSIKLEARDAKTLLVLSDVSGPGSRLPKSGYLTGYPLPAAGLYALARTWPAPEMPRPGCVWTHTLLIDFADLATIRDPRELKSFYKRPISGPSGTYENPIKLEMNQQPSRVSEAVALHAKPYISALYQLPSKKVIAFDEDNEIAEEAILSIWGQQWPRLRRSFRFCTLASSDRSTKDAIFDLQILPNALSSAKSRFVGSVEAYTIDKSTDWLETAMSDLTTVRHRGLRDFLFQAGSDLQNGRAAFANLCRIYRLLESPQTTRTDLETVIELVPESSNSAGARALAGIVTRRLFDRGGKSSKKILSYIVDHVEFLDAEAGDDRLAVFGIDLLRTLPSLFQKMSDSRELGSLVVRATFDSATTEEIATAIKTTPSLASRAIEYKPTLIYEPDIWREIDVIDTNVLKRLAALENVEDALCAAIIADRRDLSEALLSKSSGGDLFAAVQKAQRDFGLEWSVAYQWIRKVGTPEVAAEFLSTRKPLDWRFMFVLSEVYGPDEIPNWSGRDPWLSAVKSGQGKLSTKNEIDLHAYLLSRALGDVTRNSAELTKFSFVVTDWAASRSELTYESWIQLERRLPWSMLWQDSDKCYRIRKGVAEKSVEEQWPADLFVALTSDDEVFATLVAFAKRSFRGRQYLKEVRNTLKNSSDADVEKRCAIIKQILRRY